MASTYPPRQGSQEHLLNSNRILRSRLRQATELLNSADTQVCYRAPATGREKEDGIATGETVYVLYDRGRAADETTSVSKPFLPMRRGCFALVESSQNRRRLVQWLRDNYNSNIPKSRTLEAHLSDTRKTFQFLNVKLRERQEKMNNRRGRKSNVAIVNRRG